LVGRHIDVGLRVCPARVGCDEIVQRLLIEGEPLERGVRVDVVVPEPLHISQLLGFDGTPQASRSPLWGCRRGLLRRGLLRRGLLRRTLLGVSLIRQVVPIELGTMVVVLPMLGTRMPSLTLRLQELARNVEGL